VDTGSSPRATDRADVIVGATVGAAVPRVASLKDHPRSGVALAIPSRGEPRLGAGAVEAGEAPDNS
jgi:hypothetical protein